jgi:class 3 adenylate cyclase
MALKDELETYVQKVLDDQWTRRKGQKVPDPEDLPLSNVAVELDATVLYADLAASTKMTKGYKDWFAAEVYKNYLYCASKIIRARGGSITAYDGDRVMAVFIGDSKNSNAAKCALQINWASQEIVQAKLKRRHPETPFELKQRVGVDTSQLFIARTGIRGSNDLVWVGNASNNAAKMATLPTTYPSYITADVYGRLADWAKIGSDGRNMWTDLGTRDLGYRIYGSTWWWSL